MPISRFSGGTNTPSSIAVIMRSPMRMRPLVGRSSPAIQRKQVVLPQPDGPTSTSISPCLAPSDTALSALTSPKVLPRFRAVISARLRRGRRKIDAEDPFDEGDHRQHDQTEQQRDGADDVEVALGPLLEDE